MFCNLQRWPRTQAVLVIGLYELLDPTTSFIGPPGSFVLGMFHLKSCLFNIQSYMIEDSIYLQNMCLVSIQHHNAHLNTVRSRCYIPRHLNNDIYSCSLHQRYFYHTLSLAHVLKVKNVLYKIVCLINMIIDGGEHE
jgi:hypothetical protein